MSKKHLMFEIKSWPDDVPEDDAHIMWVKNGFSGLYCECHKGVWDFFTTHKLQDGDTYIVLSEGEVVEKHGGMRVEGSNTIHWSFTQEKEGEGDE